MVAEFDPDHTHSCRFEKEHICPEHMCVDEKCRRYFWKKGTYV
jgi:hypothetical protein